MSSKIAKMKTQILKKEGEPMKNKKARIFSIALALVFALALTVGCAAPTPAPTPTPAKPALDVAEIGAAIDGIKADMSDLEAAADVIHNKTDVILEGEAPLPDEVLDMTEAVHMSSHAMKLLAVHMNSYIGKLDTYKGDPEKNRGKILAAAGKIEALRKIFIESTTTTDFSGWMEWPYTEKAPHDTVHILIGDDDIKANPEYKEAADAMHEAMHAFEEAGGSMRFHLEDLLS